MSKNRIVAVVGMPGSGKSIVSQIFIKMGYHYIRFGQLTMDEIKKRGLETNEKNERKIREEFRKKHGMAAYAILHLPKIEEAIAENNVIIDGLYSWSEYKVLREEFGENFYVVAVYAPPFARYQRLKDRKAENDADNKFRAIDVVNAIKRDYAEIEKVEKGGPIAMADFTIKNDKTIEDLGEQIKELINEFQTE